MRGVKRRARGFRQRQVPPKASFLRARRDALDAQAAGHGAVGEHTARRKRRVFAVVNDGDAQSARAIERRVHQLDGRHRPSVVGERYGARRDERAEIRERFALASLGHRGNGKQAREAHAPRLGRHRLGRLRAVVDRLGVGHRADGCEASGHGRGESRFEGFRRFTSRLTEMTMQVNEAGRDDLPARIEHFVRARFDSRRNLLDDSAFGQHVHHALQLVGGGNHSPASDEQ